MAFVQLVLDESESTQIELKTVLGLNPELEELSFVQAYRQRFGRGRQGRVWASPSGNLYLSVLLKDRFSTWTPHFVAHALYESLLDLRMPEGRLKIKWPNDLWVDDKKIAGIVCEKLGENIITGIGVNVLVIPEGIDRPATSIHETLDSSLEGSLNEDSIIQLRDCFLERLSQRPSLPELKHAYQRRLLFKSGQKIFWRDEITKSSHAGEFLKIGMDGELIIFENGSEKKLFSEEIHLVSKPVMN